LNWEEFVQRYTTSMYKFLWPRYDHEGSINRILEEFFASIYFLVEGGYINLRLHDFDYLCFKILFEVEDRLLQEEELTIRSVINVHPTSLRDTIQKLSIKDQRFVVMMSSFFLSHRRIAKFWGMTLRDLYRWRVEVRQRMVN
jgi:hypothetical protein